MRRTIFGALLAAALLVPSVAHGQGNQTILRDCADDGILQGNYSASAMRTARNNIPAELEEYSDCRDVLSRAIASKTASSGGGGTGGGTSGGGSLGGSGAGGVTGSSGGLEGGTGTASPAAPAPRPAIPPGPQTESDVKALAQALNNGPQPVQVGGKAVSPGASRLAASVGRNSVPSPLYAVFALLALSAGVAIGASLLQRRADGRPAT